MHDSKAMFKKMMEKKGSKELSPIEKKARIGVVEGLRKFASDEMKERGLKKVTVASDSEEGLSEGLDIAKAKLAEMTEESPKHESMKDESEDEESEESPEHEMMESEDEESEDEIEKQLKELMAKRDRIKSKRSE